jgi:hypothetical protein
LSREEIVEKIDDLTVGMVREAGAAALRTSPTVAAVGPIAKVYSPNRVRKRLGLM